jgi:hypothetical protein
VTNQQKSGRAVESKRPLKPVEVSVIVEQTRDVGQEPERFDEQFFGSREPVGCRGGWHETGPLAPDDSRWPGNVALDPEEDAMNLQVRQEVDRLRREVPDLRQFNITPGLHWSGDADHLTVDALPWKVTFFAGEGLFIGEGPTLQAAMTDGVDTYKASERAKALDAVPAVAGEQVAA